MKDDFEFLSGLAWEFFSKRPIRDTLFTIAELEISGWEKWIQIEFAKFCMSHEDVADWNRELRFELDRRLTSKEACAIDFLIRQKRKQSFLAVEIKQRPSPGGCVKAMVQDMAKLQKIRRAQDNLRGIWCMGVHTAESLTQVNNSPVGFKNVRP